MKQGECSPQATHLAAEFSGEMEAHISEYLRPWLQQYISRQPEVSVTPWFRLDIVFYELGALMRKLCYRRARPNSPRCGGKDEIRQDFGDAVVNLMLTAEIMNVDIGHAITEALERLEANEYRKV